MAGGLEQLISQATDANGNTIPKALGAYGSNKDAGHPDSDGQAKTWVVKLTNTAATVTLISGTNGANTFVLKTGSVYRFELLGVAITEKAFIQFLFGENTAPDTNITIPTVAGGTNGVTAMAWTGRDPLIYKALPGQKHLAVAIGPVAFAAPDTNGPWLSIWKLS